ncbi:MAG: hypothetical protein QF733_00915 [Phycisphaerales bacterium]|jgi:hypothetical protein|nr:hypothetical protein [Phycisphaerales bacterium]
MRPSQIVGLCLVISSGGASASQVDEARLMAEAATFDWTLERADVVQMRVVFHIIRHNDGSDGLYYWQDVVEDSLADANANLAGAGIELVLEGQPRFLDDSSLYWIYWDWDDYDQFYELINTDSVPGAINVYQVPNLLQDGERTPGLSTMPGDPLGQGIVINNYSTPGLFGDSATFSHEIGHYLHLYDTQENWMDPPDETPPAGWWGVECPDASNCATAGDLLCDTPTHPGLADTVDGDCAYVGDSYPPEDSGCGDAVAYAPLTDNIMSTAPVSCRTAFTCDQLNVMSWSARNERADHIVANRAACLGDVSGDCEAGMPPDGVVDEVDVASMVSQWGGTSPAWDLDQDGVVGVLDLIMLLEAWGPCS